MVTATEKEHEGPDNSTLENINYLQLKVAAVGMCDASEYQKKKHSCHIQP